MSAENLPARKVVAVSAAYSADGTEDVILCDPSGGAFTVKLANPATGSEASGIGAGSSVIAQSNVGKLVVVRSNGTTNAVTVTTVGGTAGIDGAAVTSSATFLPSGATHSVQFVSDGTNYYVAAVK